APPPPPPRVRAPGRLALEPQPHVQITHGLGHAHVRRRSGGDDGYAIADMYSRLLLVLHPDARIGKQVRVPDFVAEIQDDRRYLDVARSQMAKGMERERIGRHLRRG